MLRLFQSKMEIIDNIEDMKDYTFIHKMQDIKVGFIPTMGYLHEGHLSLIRKAREECDVIIVSIYVNPTQFAPNEDLNSYPKDYESDKQLCINEEVDALFIPSNKEMYPEGYNTYVDVKNITKVLCGKSRPTHFRGVSTVICKLFNIIKPHNAYFGQKDYQQTVVIKQMLKDLNMDDTDIVVCPIVREEDGLAMSSRNEYLSTEERAQAPILNEALIFAKQQIENDILDTYLLKTEITKIISGQNLAEIEYVEILNKNTLSEITEIQKDNTVIALAIKFGKARLIDNILI